MYNNGLLALRNWQASLVRILAPLIFMIIIYGFNQAFTQVQNGNSSSRSVRSPAEVGITAIPDCTTQDYEAATCYDFVYTPVGDSLADAVAASMRANNPGRAIPASRVLGFSSTSAVDAWLYSNPRSTPGAVHFNVSADRKTIGFGLQVNGTAKSKRSIKEDLTFFALVPLQVATEREIARTLSGAGAALSWTVGTVPFAHPPLNPFSIVGAFAPTCLMIAGEPSPSPFPRCHFDGSLRPGLTAAALLAMASRARAHSICSSLFLPRHVRAHL